MNYFIVMLINLNPYTSAPIDCMDSRIVDIKSWIHFFYGILQRCIDEINELGASMNEQTIQKLYLKLVELNSTICQGTKFIQDIISNIEYDQGKTQM